MGMMYSFPGLMKSSQFPLVFFHQLEVSEYSNLENYMFEMPEPEERRSMRG